MSELNDEHLLNGDEDDTDYDLDEREEALLLDEEYDNTLPCEELNEADNQSSEANKCKREGKFTTERKVITAPTTNPVQNNIPDTLDQVNIDITQIRNFKQKNNRKQFVRGKRNGFNRYDSQQRNWRDKRDFNANRTVHINPHFSGINSPWETQQFPQQFPNNQMIQPWAPNVFTQMPPAMNNNFPVMNQQQYPAYNNYPPMPPFVDSSMPPMVHMDRPPMAENNALLQNAPMPHSQMMNHGNNFFPQTNHRMPPPPMPPFHNQPQYPNPMQPMHNMEPLQNMYQQPCHVTTETPQPLSDPANMYQPQLGFGDQESRPIDFQIQLTTHNNVPVHQRLGISRKVSITQRRSPAFYHAKDKQLHQNGKQMDDSRKQIHNSPNKILSDNARLTGWKNNHAALMSERQNIEIISQSKTESPLITCVTKESSEDEDEDTKSYRLKIEEQKRRREEILQRKEERRKMAAVQNNEFETSVTADIPRAQHTQQFSFTNTRPQRTPRSINTNPNITRIVPISNIKIIVPSESSHIAVKTTNSLLNDITINTGPLSRKITVKPPNTITTKVNHFSIVDQQLLETRSVSIRNLSANTKERKLIAMCRGVGDVQKLHLDKQKRQATIEFKSVAAAHSFFKKYQRHMLDLSVIEVNLADVADGRNTRAVHQYLVKY